MRMWTNGGKMIGFCGAILALIYFAGCAKETSTVEEVKAPDVGAPQSPVAATPAPPQAPASVVQGPKAVGPGVPYTIAAVFTSDDPRVISKEKNSMHLYWDNSKATSVKFDLAPGTYNLILEAVGTGDPADPPHLQVKFGDAIVAQQLAIALGKYNKYEVPFTVQTAAQQPFELLFLDNEKGKSYDKNISIIRFGLQRTK